MTRSMFPTVDALTKAIANGRYDDDLKAIARACFSRRNVIDPDWNSGNAAPQPKVELVQQTLGGDDVSNPETNADALPAVPPMLGMVYPVNPKGFSSTNYLINYSGHWYRRSDIKHHRFELKGKMYVATGVGERAVAYVPDDNRKARPAFRNIAAFRDYLVTP